MSCWPLIDVNLIGFHEGIDSEFCDVVISQVLADIIHTLPELNKQFLAFNAFLESEELERKEEPFGATQGVQDIDHEHEVVHRVVELLEGGRDVSQRAERYLREDQISGRPVQRLQEVIAISVALQLTPYALKLCLIYTVVHLLLQPMARVIALRVELFIGGQLLIALI